MTDKELKSRIDKIYALDAEWKDCGLTNPTTAKAYNALLDKRQKQFDEMVAIIRSLEARVEEQGKLLEAMGEALKHLTHNAKVSGANMGLGLDVAKDALKQYQSYKEERDGK
jgi:methyl-accepting chemotaxis protein